MNKISIKTFIKAQFSSIVSTITDFSITWILTSIVGYWYVFSSFTGTTIGGITNFVISRHWVFSTTNTKKTEQILKYLLVWAGGIIFNTLGVYLFTDLLTMHYILSKALISVIVGVFFNYYLQSNFVFNEHS